MVGAVLSEFEEMEFIPDENERYVRPYFFRQQMIDIKHQTQTCKDVKNLSYTVDACIDPTNIRDFIVFKPHNRRVEARFDRLMSNKL